MARRVRRTPNVQARTLHLMPACSARIARGRWKGAATLHRRLGTDSFGRRTAHFTGCHEADSCRLARRRVVARNNTVCVWRYMSWSRCYTILRHSGRGLRAAPVGRANGSDVKLQAAHTRERTSGTPLAALHTVLTLSVCKRRDAVRLALNQPARPAGAAFGGLSASAAS